GRGDPDGQPRAELHVAPGAQGRRPRAGSRRSCRARPRACSGNGRADGAGHRARPRRGGHGGRVLRNRTGRSDGLSRLLAVIGVALVLAPAAAAKVFVIEGRGWGHGLGMSQWGAEGFAEHGVGYRAILAHYYPGTQLARMAGSSVRVLLADSRAQFVVAS